MVGTITYFNIYRTTNATEKGFNASMRYAVLRGSDLLLLITNRSPILLDHGMLIEKISMEFSIDDIYISIP